MRVESKLASSKGFINLQDKLFNSIMDVRSAKAQTPHRKLEYCRSLSQGHGGKVFRYFTSESLFLLVCLTVSLLILPLILPPLPPPPFLLLLLPICILALLMILAFMPSNVRESTYTYV